MLSRDKDFLKMFFAALFVIFILALQGCAATQIEKGSGEEAVAIKELDSFNSCNRIVFGDPTTVGMKDDQAFMVKMQSQTVKLVASATGKNPCSLKTFRDVQLAEVAEMNKTAQVAIGRTADVATTGIVTWGATKIADSAFKAAGDNNTTGGDVTTVTGDENVSTLERNPETTTTTTTSTATTAGATSPATANPAAP